METVEGKVKNLESHLKSVRDELTNTLQMRNTRKKEFDTERHFSVVAERENGRLQQLARKMLKNKSGHKFNISNIKSLSVITCDY